jgi:hypothetical protein
MGTLFSQRPRDHRVVGRGDVINDMEAVKEIAESTGSTKQEVIELMRVMEMERQSNLYVDNGDAFDEQLEGFGYLIREFIDVLLEYAPPAIDVLDDVAKGLQNIGDQIYATDN